MIGHHLILEASGCSRRSLLNLDLIGHVLDAYPIVLNLTPTKPRFTFIWNDPPPNEMRVSGLVILPKLKTHISIHTFPGSRQLTLDIFSPSAFNITRAIRYCDSIFDPSGYERQVSRQGSETPRRISNLRRSQRVKMIAQV